MADQDAATRRRAEPAADNEHQVVDIDEARRRAADQDVQGGAHRGAVRHDDPPEATDGVPDAAPVTADGAEQATKALERTQWAILKELRAGRKYRETNPPRPAFLADNECEQCGTSRATFEDLVHHQFTAHPEVFVESGELMLEAPACMCRQCAGPGPYLDWLRTPEGRGAKG